MERSRSAKLSNTARKKRQMKRALLLAVCWITFAREKLSEICFVKIQAPLEPSRTNRQLR
jgi:hypothetical protein